VSGLSLSMFRCGLFEEQAGRNLIADAHERCIFNLSIFIIAFWNAYGQGGVLYNTSHIYPAIVRSIMGISTQQLTISILHIDQSHTQTLLS